MPSNSVDKYHREQPCHTLYHVAPAPVPTEGAAEAAPSRGEDGAALAGEMEPAEVEEPAEEMEGEDEHRSESSGLRPLEVGGKPLLYRCYCIYPCLFY